MRSLLSILLAFSALFGFTASGFAADFAGKWSGEGVTNGETHPLVFLLKQEGGKLIGTGGPDEGEQHPFKTVEADGAKIVLEIAIGENASLHFELTLEGDSLKGTVTMTRDDGKESGPVTLKRAGA